MDLSGTASDFERDPAGVMRALRRDIIDMAERSAHVGTALSCVEIIAALYFGGMHPAPPGRDPLSGDVFILSKGHGAMALYAVLARAGYFPPDTLTTYSQDGSILAEHPLAGQVPGLAFAAGSLGHGLAAATGVAKGFRLQGRAHRVFALLGDGECDEGAVWEAAAAARAQGLDNVTAIVDCNGLQACGTCREVTPGLHLPGCWRGFGWQVEEADGHDVLSLREHLRQSNPPGIPRVILARTVKGKGVSFMENDLEWHYRPVRGAEREAALECLRDA